MAKKNKKNSKINQRIKTYFDGDPFDVGVQRVSSEVLSELIHTLGIYDTEHTKESLLKISRMLWSEADGYIRQDILNFFSANGKIYPSSNPKEPSIDKEQKIQDLLLELDTTYEEDVALIDAFSATRTKKITIPKLEAKLKHIRFEVKKAQIEKALDGVFDIYDRLEFNASLRYTIFEQTFYKILTLVTKEYDYEFIDEKSIEEIVEVIEVEKQRVIELKQTYTDNFLSTIETPHKYLTDKEIITALKSSPPKTSLSYPSLKQAILESLVGVYLDLIELSIHDKELLLTIRESYTLPFSNIDVEYNLDLNIELDSLLEDIWLGRDLDFTQVVLDAKKEHEELFLNELAIIVSECGEYCKLLHFNDEELHLEVYKYLVELLPKNLHISSKVARKTKRIFIYNIQEKLIKKQRHALLARTIRDFKNLFPLAREMRRKLILHIGPTNSGKTYQAMQKLQEADTGYYLAPLRLLALEGYETLKQNGVNSSLITGEEQIIDDEATHISSTIEMLNFEVDVDVCVIDEVQMIDDRDRGWAWANAIIGTPAKEIVMTGSSNVKEAIIALADYLGEELEIIEFERKNQLLVLDEETKIEDVKPRTAIIAFSRKDVLKLKQTFSKSFSVSVVYGNLSPEVRREEARRFREGETQILIATDAIAMGMNLPIDTILFSKAQKFDGIRQRDLVPSEVHQISGRAGRFGLSEAGFVGALNTQTLKIVKRNFHKADKKIDIPFKVMANLEHIKLVGDILEESSLREILKFFVENMEFNGPFNAASLSDMLDAASIVDKYELDIATKYHLACAPLTLKSPYIVSAYESYIKALEQQKQVPYIPPKLKAEDAHSADDLLRVEDMVKEISLYLWLSYRFNEFFLDEHKARVSRGVLNRYIEKTLQKSQLASKCRTCESILPLNSKHFICERCFKKQHKRASSYRGRRR